RWVRQLQQGLADALKKNSLAEASLEAKKRYSRDLQEQKLQLQKELDRSKAKLQELRERRTQTECYAESLKNAIKNKKRELTTSRNLQGLLVASSRTAAIPELEERKQRLQVEKARLEATAQQQAKTIETLEKVLQASAS
ncbi:PREDICTED: ankyrin repeat domain-containing protein 26-like, partial [Pygoscelis adeliae]|uniref:ankyrin repeat domain-containing protein 26-like n=1 Tax=Pygoscelis adeliae TaxID=9238 RepID=UPI0004F4EDD8